MACSGRSLLFNATMTGSRAASQATRERFRNASLNAGFGATMMTTNVRHIAISQSRSGQFDDRESPDQEASPNGNAVSLESQMIKVSETQAEFQAAANLYAKAMTLMKTAIGH